MKFRIRVSAAPFRESHIRMCSLWDGSDSAAAEATTGHHQSSYGRGTSRADVLSAGAPTTPQPSSRPTVLAPLPGLPAVRVLHFGYIYTNTPIHWYSTNRHSTYSVLKPYPLCQIGFRGTSTVLCQHSSIFLDFHQRYNSILRAKNPFIMFQHLHLYYADETWL